MGKSWGSQGSTAQCPYWAGAQGTQNMAYFSLVPRMGFLTLQVPRECLGWGHGDTCSPATHTPPSHPVGTHTNTNRDGFYRDHASRGFPYWALSNGTEACEPAEPSARPSLPLMTSPRPPGQHPPRGREKQELAQARPWSFSQASLPCRLAQTALSQTEYKGEMARWPGTSCCHSPGTPAKWDLEKQEWGRGEHASPRTFHL